MSDLLRTLAGWPVGVVHSSGYTGLFVPLPGPSEVILPLAGFLTGQGRLSFVLVLLTTTVNSTAGSLVLYGAGRMLGEDRVRGLVRRYGRFVLVGESDLDGAHGWFERDGGEAVFIARPIPEADAKIRAPAGIERMSLPRFVLYSGLSALVWNGAFVGLGWVLGDRWREAEGYAHAFEYSLRAVIFVGLLWYL